MQTSEGARKARDTILAKDPDFYKKMGATARKRGNYKTGFALNPELASRAGKIGGFRSKRKKV